MPFTNDIRVGYFQIDFNMSWFYTVLEDTDREIEFLPSKRCDGTEDKCIAFSVSCFEKYIENKAEEFIIARCNFKDVRLIYGLDYTKYDSIWEYLLEEMECYEHRNEIKITYSDESDNDE